MLTFGLNEMKNTGVLQRNHFNEGLKRSCHIWGDYPQCCLIAYLEMILQLCQTRYTVLS